MNGCSLFGFGRNDFGQLGIISTEDLHQPTLIFQEKVIKRVACGSAHTLVLKEEGLFAFGYNSCGKNTFRNNFNF